MGDKRLWIGTGISLFFLFLLFSRIDSRQLGAPFLEVDPCYLIATVLAIFLSYCFRALRWKYLLLPLKKCPMATVFLATIIGLMVNGLFPARLGEFVRTHALAEKENLAKGSVFASQVIDRLTDVISLLLLLAATLLVLDLPNSSAKDRQALVAGGCATLAVSLLAVLFLISRKVGIVRLPTPDSRMLRRMPAKPVATGIRILRSFIEGISRPAKSSRALAVIATSILAWVFSVIPVDLVLGSLGISLPIFVSMFILVMLGFAVMVPATPGYVGTFHYACFAALGAYQIPQAKARRVALVLHAASFVPVIVAGFFYLWKDGISLNAEFRDCS